MQDLTPGLTRARSSGGALDDSSYIELEERTIDHPVVYFGSVEKNLYHDILNRCVAGRDTCIDEWMQHNNTEHDSHQEDQVMGEPHDG